MNNSSENNKQIRVALYLRVSTDEQVEKYGIDMQKESLQMYIKSRGQFDDGRDKMILAGDEYVYIDEGISGRTPIDARPAFSRLIEDMQRASSETRPFDAVAVYKTDRFARKLTILLDVIELFDEYNIQFISVNEAIDTSTPFGRAILGIMGVIAELEVETTKQRSHDGRIQSQKKGVVINMKYGYMKNIDKRYVVFDKEAGVVKEIFNLCVFEGMSTKEIASFLSEQKIVSPEISAIQNEKRKGKARKINDIFYWRTDSVRNILKDEVYIGRYYYGLSKEKKQLPKEEWTLSEHSHEPIIEMEIFNKAQEKLLQSAEKSSLNRKRDADSLYLLSGLLKCSTCSKENEKMHTWSGGKKEIGKHSGVYSYYYSCGHKNNQKYGSVCPTIPIPAEQVESYIVAFIKSLLINPKITFEYQEKLNSNKAHVRLLKVTRQRLIKYLSEIPDKRRNLLTQHTNNYITDSELDIEMKTFVESEKLYRKKLDDISAILGKHEISEGYIKNFAIYEEKYRNALKDIYEDKNETYTLIHSLIDEIIVYSRPFNPKFDRIAGKKKNNQQIPNSIMIKLKLPDVLLNQLVKNKLKEHLEFAVRTTSW